LLRAEFVAAVSPCLEGQQLNPNSDLIIVAAKRLIEAEPFQEAGYRALMRAYAQRREFQAASRVYNKLERLLTGELGCKPSPVTRELSQTLSNKERRPAATLVRSFAAEVDKKAAPNVSTTIAVRRDLPRLAVLAPTATNCSIIAQELIDNFANDLATRLSQTRSLVVTVPVSSTVEIGGPVRSDAEYLLEIRPRRGAKAPAIFVRLLEVSTREILWANDLDSSEVFAEAVSSMVHSIVGHVENREIHFLSRATDAKSAYRLTIQGQRSLQIIDLPSIRRARALFKAAIVAAANHIPAFAGLARSYVLEWLVRMNPERSLLDTAEQCARRILSICPDDYRGFRELGFVQMYLKKIDMSVENLGHSAHLNPTDLDVQVDLANAMTLKGYAGEGIRLFTESKLLRRRGLDYDHWILAGAYYHTGNYQAALEEIACMQNPVPALKLLAATHAMLGERAVAQRAKIELMEFNPDFELTRWLSTVPCQDRHYVGHYSDGLRAAGFA
jgi:tetratricopeptide (TPR) repeat protein